MLDAATQQRQAFCRRTLRYNGSIRRGAVECLAAVGVGVLIGQVLDLLLWLIR